MEVGTCGQAACKLSRVPCCVNSPERTAQGLLPPSNFTQQNPVDFFPLGPHFPIPKEYSHRDRQDEEPHSQRAEHREVAVSEMNTCPPLGMGSVLQVSLPSHRWRALSPSLGEDHTFYISLLNCYTFLLCSSGRGLCYQQAGEELPSGTACASQTDGCLFSSCFISSNGSYSNSASVKMGCDKMCIAYTFWKVQIKPRCTECKNQYN